ncbi:MAG: ATP-binding protein [Pseudomonadota bacterium]
MIMLEYEFLKTAGRILNSGQTRTLILTGNIHDLFGLSFSEGLEDGSLQNRHIEYLPLVNYLAAKWNVPKRILLIYELNGPIRFLKDTDRDKVKDAWLKWRTGLDANALAIKKMLETGKTRSELDIMSKAFETNLQNAVGNPTVALELLRQICLCSRGLAGEKTLLSEDLIILIEAADILIPEGEILRLSDADRHRVSICQDWFSDPGFMNGGDAVILMSESRSLINHRVSRLPQVIEIKIPAPDQNEREAFIAWFDERQPSDKKVKSWGSIKELARFTASLSIHELRQLLMGSCYEERSLSPQDVTEKVETFIQAQLGEDVVEFKKPSHRLDDLVGFSRLKEFLRKELIPRFSSTGADALSGAAVCGPIGSGKTYIFEAVASEVDMIVLVLKNIRSQWFGQTDVIFERLRRVLDALSKVLIFVDEADTQFGSVGADAHDTERRLTGKIQAMMSDSRLRGRVVWLLMTARIHLLSPDIRRPGRVGDLIIPVLDPEGTDRDEFLTWMITPVCQGDLSKEQKTKLLEITQNFSAASFASLRSELKAKAVMKKGALAFDEILDITGDHIPPAIFDTRRYQTLQALVNCTRKSLLPDLSVKENRSNWESEIRALEARGVG